jgi:DNA-binding NtrC family response regulator
MSQPSGRPERERILVVEDQAGMRSFLAAALEDAGYEVVAAADGRAALRLLDEQDVQLVLTDLKMPGADGMAVLRHAQKVQPEAPVLVLTAFGSIEAAVAAMKEGAADFLTKPVDSPEVLALTVARALEGRRLRAENERLRRSAPPATGFGDIVHADPRTAQVLRLAQAVAPTDATVLLLGESGTGKEVFARAIHEASRGDRPFVAVNCAALPRDLLESELFGHEKGAFTGAAARRTGRFELAADGTLFLDEVGEIAPELQAKLLRVLQEGTFERVGGTRTLRFAGRVMAATNRDLKAQVATGRFREDLFYRLNVFPIEIPPLRERPGDIIPVAEHLLRQQAVRTGRPPLVLAPETARLLLAWEWPGNVRELQNVLERAAILARGAVITPDLLPVEIAESAVAAHRTAAPARDDGGTLSDLERQAILDTLEQTGGNRRLAAERLGISLRTLQYRLASWRSR